MARLFFALWPDDKSAAALAALAQDVALVTGGRPMPREKIHLTLAFLGEVPEGRAAALAGAVPRVERVRVSLDCVGSFRRARVAWAGSLAPNEPLARLQGRLAAALRDGGFELEDRPFAAHLTLARKIAKPLPRASIAPIAWTAKALALVRSDLASGAYETVASWPLAAAGR